jgi:hypothetical protein
MEAAAPVGETRGGGGDHGPSLSNEHALGTRRAFALTKEAIP